MSQNNIPTWTYNGASFEYDILDIETAENYEKTFDIYGKKEKELPKTGSQAEIMKAHCCWFRGIFDGLLGDGASKKIFGDKYNLRICYDAYESFLDFIAAQRQSQTDKATAISNKYSNRASRRAAAKK